MSNHAYYLRRCFELARKGESRTFPNPIVAAVIVNANGEIIGEGFHEYYGGAHAEVNAVTYCQNLEELKNSTLYVSLEPCAHHGKTPPCTDLIIKHQFKRLVFSSYDPNPKVSGQGLARIRAAGIEIIEPKDLNPELVKESDNLNKPFFKLIKNGRHWITLKVALNTKNEFIKGAWQTGEEARKAVHRLRSTHQLLVTSIRTVIADDPEYNVRFSPEELSLKEIKNPDILILKSSTDFTEDERKTLRIFDPKYNRKVFEANIPKDYKDLESCLESFSQQGYQKIMVEAGPRLSQAFLDAGLVDEYIEFKKQ